MKRFTLFALICLFALSIAACASAAGLGPVTKAADAVRLPDDAYVVVKGTIKATAPLNRYVLEDGSGEVVFGVKPHRLNGVALKVGDKVEVAGEMDQDSMHGAKIEAYAVVKEGEPVKYMTVAQALKSPEDAWIVAKGRLKLKIDHDEYTFADASGEMVVEIDHEDWCGASFDPNKEVELRGEIDYDKGVVKLEVDFVREL